MEYGSQGEWREVGLLPSPRLGLSGAAVGGIFYACGGGEDQHTSYTNDLASFDPVSESWASAGHLTFTRKWHAVAEIGLSTIPSANCSFSSKRIWLHSLPLISGQNYTDDQLTISKAHSFSKCSCTIWLIKELINDFLLMTRQCNYVEKGSKKRPFY